MATIGNGSQQQQLSDDPAPKTKGRAAGRKHRNKAKKQRTNSPPHAFDHVPLDANSGSDFESTRSEASFMSVGTTDEFQRLAQGVSITNEALSRVQTKYGELAIAYQKSEGRREHWKELNTHLGFKISDLEEEIAALKQRIEDMKNETLNDKEQIRELQAHNTELLAKIGELERLAEKEAECNAKLLKDKDARLKRFEDQCATLQVEKAMALGKLAETKENFTLLITEKEKLSKEKEELSNALDSKNTALDNLQKEFEAEKDLFEDTSSAMETLRNEKADLNTHITSLQAQNQGLEVTIKDRDSNLEHANAKLIEQANQHGEAKGEFEYTIARLKSNNAELKEKYERKKTEALAEGKAKDRAEQAIEEKDRLLKDNQARHKSQTAEIEKLRKALAAANLNMHKMQSEQDELLKELAEADARHEKQKAVINTKQDNYTAEHHKNLKLMDDVKHLHVVNNTLREERDKLRKSDLGVQARKRNHKLSRTMTLPDFQKHRQSNLLEVPIMREIESQSPILSSKEASPDLESSVDRNAEGRVTSRIQELEHC